MGHQYFNVPIFFIVFRETIEAAIIVSVLLSFVEQLMLTGKLGSSETSIDNADNPQGQEQENAHNGDDHLERRRHLIRRMRIQIWAGTIVGFLLALAIGAAFIAVFYTKLDDLWAKTEQIWEGVFSIIASIIIYIMGVAFLKMDKSRIKWRLKLAKAFDASQNKLQQASEKESELDRREARSGKWALFILPFITVLREGLEAVVFVGGVSLDVEAVSIPIAVIVGIIAGLVFGYAIYRTGSTATLHWFLVGSTSFLFLIGAGLFSKGIGYFQYYRFAQGVGGDVAETGDGPGSFQVAGNVWHLTYGNPETGSPTTNGGWQIFNAIFGWNNTATLGSILGYVFYWILIMVTLVYLRWKEGRFTLVYPSYQGGSLVWQRKESEALRRRKAGKGIGRRVSHGSGSGSDDKHTKTEPETPGLNVPTLGASGRAQ